MSVEKMVRTTVEIPYILHKDIRVQAAVRGLTLGGLYTEIMLAGASQLKIQAKDRVLCIKQRKT